MQVTKLTLASSAVMPLMAALPYRVVLDGPDAGNPIMYDPETQLSFFAHHGSTSTYGESIDPLFGKSRSDTRKDD